MDAANSSWRNKRQTEEVSDFGSVKTLSGANGVGVRWCTASEIWGTCGRDLGDVGYTCLESISLRIPHPNAYRDQGGARNHDSGLFLNNGLERTVAIWREYALSQRTVRGRVGSVNRRFFKRSWEQELPGETLCASQVSPGQSISDLSAWTRLESSREVRYVWRWQRMLDLSFLRWSMGTLGTSQFWVVWVRASFCSLFSSHLLF